MIEAALERASSSPSRATSAGGVRLRRPARIADAHYLLGPEALVDSEAAPSLETHVEVVKAEGEEAFRAQGCDLSRLRGSVGLTDVDSQLLSRVMLHVLDEKWKDHLYDLDQLRTPIHYRSWGQKDPLVEYKHEAYTMFVDLMATSTHVHRALPQDSGERGAAAAGDAATGGPASRARSAGAGSADVRSGRPVHRRHRARAAPTAGGPHVPRAGAGAQQLARPRGPPGGGHRARSRPQRSLPLRVGQEIQEMPRGRALNTDTINPLQGIRTT